MTEVAVLTRWVDPVMLSGDVVRLEPMSIERHLEGLIPVGLDAELWRWTRNFVQSPDDLRGYMDEALAEQERGVSMPLVTVLQATGAPIGSTRFGSIDVANRRVEIGWTWVGRAWQRTAANTEAKYLMLRHAFETLRCVRVEFKTDALNARSRAAILRIGASEEGCLRRHMLTYSGRIRDSVFFSVLDDEWPSVKARLEEMLAR